jgi:hypothetical protein
MRNHFWVGVGVALVLLSIWVSVDDVEVGLAAAVGFFVVSAGLCVYAIWEKGGVA